MRPPIPPRKDSSRGPERREPLRVTQRPEGEAVKKSESSKPIPKSATDLEGAVVPAKPQMETSKLDISQRIAERNQLHRRRLLLRAGIFCGIVVVLVGVGWVFWSSTIFSFKKTQVEVIGDSEYLTATEVETALDDFRGEPLLRLDLKEVTANLHEINNLKSVEVKKVWPNGLKVSAIARKPVAAVVAQDGTYTLLDDELVKTIVGAGDARGLPVINSSLEDEHALSAAVSVVYELPTEFQSQITEINAGTQDNIWFRLSDGLQIEWGGKEKTALKLKVVETLRQQGDLTGVQTIDVSAPEFPITK